MKIKSMLILLVSMVCLPIHAQKDIDGQWLVFDLIYVETGLTGKSKYAEAESYLRFDFTPKYSMKVTTSPFDEGIGVPYNFKNNIIEIDVPYFLSGFPESSYKVVYQSEDTMKLQTINEENKSIEYQLLRIPVLEVPENTIEYPPITLKKIELSGGSGASSSFYNFKKGSYFHLNPIFKGSSLGSYLSGRVSLPKDFPYAKLSEILKFRITIDKKGKVVLVEKLNNLDLLIDKSLTKALKKTKWKNELGDEIKIILTFNFIKTKGQFMPNGIR
ncbi:MAG: hypothetical protein AAGA66_12750 [Bacteroidota bacterium]